MTKWEYKSSPIVGTNLAALGMEGWELVCMDTSSMHFKRPMADAPEAASETIEERMEAVTGSAEPAPEAAA